MQLWFTFSHLLPWASLCSQRQPPGQYGSTRSKSWRQNNINPELPWDRGGGVSSVGDPRLTLRSEQPRSEGGDGDPARIRWVQSLSVRSLRGAGVSLFCNWLVGAGAPSFPILGPPPMTPPRWRIWRAPRLDSGMNFLAERGLGAIQGPSSRMGAAGPGRSPRRPEAGLAAPGRRAPRVSAPPPARRAAWPFKRPDGGPS